MENLRLLYLDNLKAEALNTYYKDSPGAVTFAKMLLRLYDSELASDLQGIGCPAVRDRYIENYAARLRTWLIALGKGFTGELSKPPSSRELLHKKQEAYKKANCLFENFRLWRMKELPRVAGHCAPPPGPVAGNGQA